MKAWDNFLKQQEKLLGLETVDKWLRTLKVAHFDACNLYLEAKDAFQVMWFEEHVRKKLKNGLLNNNKKEIRVHISAQNEKALPGKSQRGKRAQAKEDPAFSIHFDELDPLATFDNYVESGSTILAHKLLCKITNYDPISKTFIPSDGDLAAFNPIYLFGGEGSGKTHLLMATANALKLRELKVVYVTAETFTEHVVTAIRAGEMSVFRQAYRNIDVLLIDDVHVFSRKGATQEELFHTFNTLHLAGKQIILSANCSPSELQNIEPRLVSRFEWGIVLPLDPLDKEDVRKVLKRKAEALEAPLHPKVEEFLLTTFTNSTKSLVHALESLVMKHHLRDEERGGQPTPLTIQTCRHLLKDLIETEKQDSLTPEKIINQVTEYFGIKLEDIFGKSQSRDCVIPRQIAMHLCRTKLKMPFKKVGEIFGRDHSTVMSSVKLVEKNLEMDDKGVTDSYFSIIKKLNR